MRMSNVAMHMYNLVLKHIGLARRQPRGWDKPEHVALTHPGGHTQPYPNGSQRLRNSSQRLRNGS